MANPLDPQARALAAGLDMLDEALDLAGLRMAHSSILGLTAQVCDIAQDDERPDDDVGAVVQHLGAAARHLAAYIALRVTCNQLILGGPSALDDRPEAPDAE